MGYLPAIAETVVAALAVTSLGAIWSVCAPEFGTQSVIDRFSQLEPKVLIACDSYRFGGREHDRSEALRKIRDALPSVHATILVADDPGRSTTKDALDLTTLVAEGCEPHFDRVPFDHPLWVLFSSGTTGLPKGLVQGHGGILLEHLKALGLGLDLHPGDRYFFFSSTSWMAWNFGLSGLLHGATIVSYAGSPGHPRADVLWQIAEESSTAVFGVGAAYVAACEKADLSLSQDFAQLRTILPTGSPLPRRGWGWLSRELPSHVRVDSICGGTDVCTAYFGGSPTLPVFAGEIGAAWLGVDVEAWDPDGRPVVDQMGEMVIRQPMPSMPVRLWNDHDHNRYRHSYFDLFPDVWRQGDSIIISANGAIQVLGRSDATLNRHGVRMGSAEIYSAVEQLPDVQDSLIVGVERPDGSYYMPMFVVARESIDEDVLRATINETLRTRVSPRHVPDEIVFVGAVPRTLTGKKLELPVKRILQGEPWERVASAGAIDDPKALAWFQSFAETRRS